MKKTLWSLIFLVPMSALAQSLSPALEQKFQEALKSKISRERVTLEHTVSTKYSLGDRSQYNLAKSPEAFALKLESIPNEGPKMGQSIANHIKKTRAIKDDLVLELKNAILNTKFLKKDGSAVTKLLSEIDVQPLVHLFETSSTLSHYQTHYVDVGVIFGGQTYCRFLSDDKYLAKYFPEYSTALFSEKMRNSIDNAITPGCIQELKDLVSKMVNEKENVLVMRDSFTQQGAQLRAALNDDGRESVKDISSPSAAKKIVQSSSAIKQ